MSGAACRLQDRKDLIERHAALVRYVAGRIAIRLPQHVCIEDLESAGIIGLIDAIDKFDPSKGARLETYAEIRIRGAILDELRSRDWLPKQVREKYRKIREAYGEVEGSLGRSATDDEVAAHMGLDLDEFHSILGRANSAALISMDELCGDSDNGRQFKDLIADETCSDIAGEICKKETMRLLAEAIDKLPEKERLVVALYYYEELTMKEIGAVLGVSESRVCQIHTKAVCRLGGRINLLEAA